MEHDVCQPFDSGLKVDYILPMASNTHPLAYSQYPIETMMINLKGAEHALNLAHETGATVVYTSTNEVYGNAVGDEDFSEDYNGRHWAMPVPATTSRKGQQRHCASRI